MTEPGDRHKQDAGILSIPLNLACKTRGNISEVAGSWIVLDFYFGIGQVTRSHTINEILNVEVVILCSSALPL